MYSCVRVYVYVCMCVYVIKHDQQTCQKSSTCSHQSKMIFTREFPMGVDKSTARNWHTAH
jgi:hypothetical protein